MLKNKQITINVIANLIAFCMSFGINFIIMPYIIEKLGSEAYSFIPIANNMVTFINIFSIALNSMGARYITIELVSNNNENANKYFNSLLVGNISLSLILVIPLSILINNINNILNVPFGLIAEVKITFFLVMLNIFITLSVKKCFFTLHFNEFGEKKNQFLFPRILNALLLDNNDSNANNN